jgi:hypothetical protein
MSLSFAAMNSEERIVDEALLGPETWAESSFWPAVRAAGIVGWVAGFAAERENLEQFAADWEKLRPLFLNWRPEEFERVRSWIPKVRDGVIAELVLG